MTSETAGSRCPRCGAALGDRSRACPSCGAEPGDAAAATCTAVEPSPATPGRTTPGPSSSPALAGGFPPGTLLAGRYRIVSPLGRGGMGVVYRAEDLKLGQAVALKFLPPGLPEDPRRLEALHAEVRNARLVSHPNVCRVFDVGDAEGHHFLSMEYVDGEDLGSLLKRIGRLPSAKAVDLAREICLGLHAAHERGVVHRDLKPANVMVDGHGRARVTDFGLALVADQGGRPGELAGTPLYMAPEQLAGQGATVRSDVYALGLVLHELFTGRRAFEATTIPALRQKQVEETPRPSRFAPDVEPAVERVILQCLSLDPLSRPASAAQVAAALPGGDPLLRAIAAGHTPSPEMVAAADTEGALPVGQAWGLLLGFLALVAVCVALAPRATLLGVVSPPKSPDALAERARDVVALTGHRDPPGDAAWWLWVDFEAARKTDGPAGVRFVYRQGPEPLVSINPLRALSLVNPPSTTPGMVTVELTATGRLLRLQSVPEPVVEGPAAGTGEADWGPLFQAAGLDPAGFTAVETSWRPSVAFDARREWEERPAQGSPGRRLRAASLEGRPVLFDVGSAPSASSRRAGSMAGAQGALGMAWLLLFTTMIVVNAAFARRSFRLGRSDLRGAMRVAVTLTTLHFASNVLRAHHAYGSALDVFHWFRTNAASAVFAGLLMWLTYVAFEPLVRRQWPHLLIGWSRLLAGRVRDPRVGRDLLRGAVAGAALAVLHMAFFALGPSLTGVGSASPLQTNLRALLGPRYLASAILWAVAWGFLGSTLATGTLALGRAVFRRSFPGVALGALLLLVVFLLGAPDWVSPVLAVGWAVLAAVSYMAVLVHFGALVAWAASFVLNLLTTLPIHLDPGAWYVGASVLTLAVVGAVAAYGFVVGLGGRSPLGADGAEG